MSVLGLTESDLAYGNLLTHVTAQMTNPCKSDQRMSSLITDYDGEGHSRPIVSKRRNKVTQSRQW